MIFDAYGRGMRRSIGLIPGMVFEIGPKADISVHAVASERIQAEQHEPVEQDSESDK